MKFRTFLFSLIAIVALSMTHASAQISAYSVFAKNNQVPDSCKTEVRAFGQIALQYPHPTSGWQFIVVCDEASWKLAMQHISMPNPNQEYGETDLDDKVTLIRGDKLVHPDTMMTPDRIVAHELAHIKLHSHDEVLVDKQAVAWIVALNRNPGTGVALTSRVGGDDGSFAMLH